MDQDEKKQEGILSTVQSTVVETAQTGLDLTKSGIESAKDVAQAAGSAVSEALTSLTARAARLVRKPRKAAARSRGKPKRAVRAAPARKPASRKSTRKPAGKKAVAKRPARKPVKKTQLGWTQEDWANL